MSAGAILARLDALKDRRLSVAGTGQQGTDGDYGGEEHDPNQRTVKDRTVR